MSNNISMGQIDTYQLLNILEQSSSQLFEMPSSHSSPLSSNTNLESLLRGSSEFQDISSKYDSFRSLLGNGNDFLTGGQDVLDQLLAQRDPQQAAQMSEYIGQKLQQAQYRPLETAGQVLDQFGINKQVGVSGSVRASAFNHQIDVAKSGSALGGLIDYDAYLKNDLSFLDARASGDARAGVEDGNLFAEAGGAVSADLVRMNTEAGARINTPFGEQEFSFVGEARVGARAEANARIQIGKDGIHAEGQAGAFVGAEAKANFETKGELGSANFGASAKVGFGAEIGGKLGFKDGKLDVKFNVGLAFIFGAKFNIGFSIDFKKIGEKIKNFFKNPVKGLVDFGAKIFKGAAKIGSKILDGVKNIGSKIADGVKKVGSKIADGVKKVGSKIVDGLKSAGKSVKKFFKKLKFW